MEYIEISSDDSSSKEQEKEKEKEKEKEQALEREREAWLWTMLRSEESPRMYPGWRVVEVGASTDPTDAGSGGAFVLRDESGGLVLARAFPVAARPAEALLRDAVALREALRAMVELGEERLIFVLPTQELRSRVAAASSAEAPRAAAAAAQRLVIGGAAAEETEVERVLRECGEWERRAPEFRLVHRRGRQLGSAHWMAETAAICRQTMQWDAPLLQDNLSRAPTP